MTKIAVILSGCGVFDGAEIHESTLVLLALDQANIEYQCIAPDVEQLHVVNHISGQPMENERRNVLIEAARISRGNVLNVVDANAADYDGVIVPGGFGAAKNLSDFAVSGADMAMNADIKGFLQALHRQNKPIGLICIAPVMAPLIFGAGVECTIGNDLETAAMITAMGGKHVECAVTDIVVDEANKLVTTPAYMLAERISEAAEGINKLVKKVLALA